MALLVYIFYRIFTAKYIYITYIHVKMYPRGIILVYIQFTEPFCEISG